MLFLVRYMYTNRFGLSEIMKYFITASSGNQSVACVTHLNDGYNILAARRRYVSRYYLVYNTLQLFVTK